LTLLNSKNEKNKFKKDHQVNLTNYNRQNNNQNKNNIVRDLFGSSSSEEEYYDNNLPDDNLLDNNLLDNNLLADNLLDDDLICDTKIKNLKIANKTSDRIEILIDYENISDDKEIAKLENYINTLKKSKMSRIKNKTIKIKKIAGFFSSKKNKADIVVRSNRKDAVDIFMVYYVGKLEEQYKDIEICIISRDKIFSCLIDFCSNVTHFPDVEDFIKRFEIE
jgi:hypothetical protein